MYFYLIQIIYTQLYGFKKLFLFNNNNEHLFTQLYGFEYSYLIQIIFKQITMTDRWDPNRFNQSRSEWT